MKRRVAVRNISRGSLLAERAELANGLVRRAFGLIGRRDWTAADGLVIEPCNAVHTCFMRLPIDVVYSAADGTVLRMVHALRPWRIGPVVHRSRWVLELPAGMLEGTGTTVGDFLQVESWPTAPSDGGPPIQLQRSAHIGTHR